MKIDIQEFKKREKYINGQAHDTLDLLIFNYNHFCQFDRAWDEYTEQARGLVTDLDGNIVVRCFRKFFNLNEREETKLENLPSELPEIVEKYDGSLGLSYYDGNKVCITTRGSFNSDQAIWATEWIQERFTKKDFKEGYTYLFEIIYPENRVVVSYGDREELILLAIKNIETGEEIDYRQEAKRLGLNFAKVVNNTLQNLITEMETLPANEEGFVLKYNNGLRVKMKGKEYLRLHAIITGTSSLSVWKALKSGTSLDTIKENVPDEFRIWLNKTINELEYKKNEYINKASKEFNSISKNGDRKDFALIAIKSPMKSFLFNLFDNKSIEDMAWKSVRPKFEKPFMTEI